MSLVDKPLRDFIAALGSPNPTPGGGSASALASAAGTALLQMVAGLPKTRSGTDEERATLGAAAAALTPIGHQLTQAIDDDASAYDRVLAAYKRPKASPDEQTERKAAIQGALRAATDVPLKVMTLTADALDHATAIAGHGHRGAASDVAVALTLLRAGFHSARLNVEINLTGNKDEAYTAAVRATVERLANRAAAAGRAADDALASE
jgi:formiminotetrahydrofolate cyclodeaminase